MRDAEATADWTAAQMQYMLRAAQQSARAQDLYYTRAAARALGTLTPTAIRDTLDVVFRELRTRVRGAARTARDARS